ncbi:MAG: glutaminyl-peptide cyclotransferase, partial [Syntrophaceae bacterium]|nr:glutaminyl-peptide cyclotransferase [Syntrophaceae bacterium]
MGVGKSGRWLSLAVVLLLLFGSAGRAEGDSFPYRVVRSYPHDRQAFTQGLFFDGGFLYEGTGLHGRSSLRKVELKTGRVLQEVRLAPEYFGEGITLWGDRIIQLTWQSRVCFVYDKVSFRPLQRFSYPHEGWGIT